MRSVGFLLAGVGVCSVIVQGVLVGRVVKLLGEQRTVLVGLVCAALGFAVQGLAPTGAVYVVGIVIMSLWGLTGPALQGLMTRLVSPTEQGQLQGANSSIYGMSNLVGPILFAQIFAGAIVAQGQWHMPGAPFLLSAVLVVAAIGVSVRVSATRLREIPAARSAV